MGFYVHIHVAFCFNDKKALQGIAQRHYDRLKVEDRMSGDVNNFLITLAQGEAMHPGPKGELCAWGHIGNYTDGAAFVETLRPFWRELYREEKDDSGDMLETVFTSQRIMVFTEAEQSGHAQAWQIGLDGDKLEIKHFTELPFSWGM